ncbi:porin family protein [candidate division KSB1 bacterium]
MKKTLILLLTAIIMSFTGNVQAQLTFDKGFKGGMTYSNLILEPESVFDYSYNPGMIAGFYLETGILKYFSVQGELLFSQKGAKYKMAQEVNIRLNYVEVPILFKLNIPVIPAFLFNINGGPYFGLKISENWSGSNILPNTDLFKRSDYGFVIGGGIKVDAFLKYICLDVRYSQSLKHIYNDIGEVNNKQLAITLGIGF